MIDSHLLNGGGVGAEREGGIRHVKLNGRFAVVCCYSPHSHGVTGPPKPDPAKRRPPTARRFYLTELAVSVRAYNLSLAPGPRQRC
jgi:hypothetical protein